MFGYPALISERKIQALVADTVLVATEVVMVVPRKVTVSNFLSVPLPTRCRLQQEAATVAKVL